MKKNVSFAALFLYNLTLITLYATKSVNPSIAINQSINQSFNAPIHAILGLDTNIPKKCSKNLSGNSQFFP